MTETDRLTLGLIAGCLIVGLTVFGIICFMAIEKHGKRND